MGVQFLVRTNIYRNFAVGWGRQMKGLLAVLNRYTRKLIFLIPVVAAAAVLYWFATNRSEPEKVSEKEVARALRVIEMRPLPVIPRAVGYGESRPSQIFQATAEVKGKIIDLHPDLKAGSFIQAGELMVAIDQTDIQISIQKLTAEIERSKASVAELEASEQNLKQSLKIETESLEIAKSEYGRSLELQKNKAISDSQVDQQRRTVLTQEQSVQNLKNNLNILPAQISSANANVQVAEANLESSKRDLDRCTIRAPFTCRLGPVDLELNEFVAVGQQLLTAQSIDKIEIEAQFPLDKVRGLIPPGRAAPRLLDQSVSPQKLLQTFLDVESTVSYGSGEARTSREANFERLREELDAQSRTIGIIVSIDRPFEREGEARATGPPPLRGTYCEVELRAKPLPGSLVVPRSAIHNEGVVFVVDGENRLRRRVIEIGLIQNNFAVISKGLNVGDRVVVSDPTPAIEGMLVDPEVDESLARTIAAEVGEQGNAR